MWARVVRCRQEASSSLSSPSHRCFSGSSCRTMRPGRWARRFYNFTGSRPGRQSGYRRPIGRLRRPVRALWDNLGNPPLCRTDRVQAIGRTGLTCTPSQPGRAHCSLRLHLGRKWTFWLCLRGRRPEPAVLPSGPLFSISGSGGVRTYCDRIRECRALVDVRHLWLISA
jgi:hypothetical protein